MLKKTVHKLLKHRHFWREIGFDELSEIYITMMFRSLAISLTNIFVPLYMLKLGYSVFDVFILMAWYFAGRGFIFDLLAGFSVVRFGPKHTIFYGYILLIFSTVLFLTLPGTHWPFWLIGPIWGGSTSLFCIPLDVDFSKIKHKRHGGKELGYMTIMEKLGGVLGPVVSGVVATLFGGQYIFLVAAAMLVVGGMPLFRTREPVKTRRPLNLMSLDIRRMKWDLLSFIPFGLELNIYGTLWPLYLALFVLASGAAYAKLGVLASVSVVASMFAAYFIGKLTDRHRGRQLLRFGAITNAVLYFFRPFITTYPGALLINVVRESSNVSYDMPYTKGMYDAVDSMPGHRAAYFTVMEMVDSLTKALMWLVFAILTGIFSNYGLLAGGFAFGALTSLLIMIERFPALDPRKSLRR